MVMLLSLNCAYRNVAMRPAQVGLTIWYTVYRATHECHAGHRAMQYAATDEANRTWNNNVCLGQYQMIRIGQLIDASVSYQVGDMNRKPLGSDNRRQVALVPRSELIVARL